MRLPAAVMLMLGALAACEELAVAPGRPPQPGMSSAPTPSEVAGAAIPPLPDTVSYLCSNGQVVRAEYPESDDPMGSRTARLTIDGESVRMIQGVSASGVRYIGGGYQWWTRGLRTATLAPLSRGESLASAPGTECRSTG